MGRERGRGVLVVVGTPIGNLEDLSPRAARALAEADVIACEDTRVARALLARALPGRRSRARLVSYHARNQHARTPEIVRRVAAGARVALTTDAGMPGLSDPGQRLVAACAEAGLRVEVVPGPSAVPAALVLSGLPAGRFAFEGFLPRTGAARRRRLEGLAREERTMVFFEAPHRITQMLEAMLAVLGDRRAALAREMTKLHEEVVRGRLSEVLGHLREGGARGEMTLVVEGAPAPTVAVGAGELAAAVARRVAGGQAKREAIATVAAERGVPKRVVYQAVIDAAR